MYFRMFSCFLVDESGYVVYQSYDDQTDFHDLPNGQRGTNQVQINRENVHIFAKVRL